MLDESGGEVVRRKSARILALEEEKRKKACTLENDSVSENQANVTRGTSTSRRGRKQKRLEDVCLSSPQDSEDPKDEDYSIYDDEAAYLSYIQEDPETRVLEFILDILQRRDRCNLFSKPVNPQEVSTYYKIIKEPMDFGTMRAKLQQRKYTSLEQFEYDVNLISTNAMHFNASTTVSYQEAQAIKELAQQLFRSLRDDPERFQLQSFQTKRGPARKPQNQGRGSHRRVHRPVGRPSTLRHPYVRRNSQAGLSNRNSSGIRNGGNSNLFETERRQTYWLSDEDKSLLSVVLDSAKILCYKGNGDSGYKESLMRFAKNLGPTAQKIAERKLAQPFSQLTNGQTQATPPIQTQNYMANAPVLALPAQEAPGHLLNGNKGQMHHGSPYHVPNRDSNASYFHADASVNGIARTNNVGIQFNDSDNRRNTNPPSTSHLSMDPNHRDKGKMVVDLNQNSGLVGTGDTEARSYPQNLKNNVRLESHIRVVRDYNSPGTSSSGIKFKAVDILGKPNPLENQQQLPSSTATSNSGILSWAVNTLANTSRQENQQPQPASTGSSNQSNLLDVMAGRSTYLKPSSSLLRSSSAMLSSLSEASTSWQDFGSQLNNNNAAKSTQIGKQLQCSQRSAEQDLQVTCSFLDMLGDTQWERSTLLREEQHLDDGNYSLGGNAFMRNEQQLGEVNYQLGNATSMRKDQLCGDSTAQWESSTFQRSEQHIADGNFLENNTFSRNEQQLNGGNFLLGNDTFLRKEQQVDAGSFHLGNSTCLWKENQLKEGNLQFGKSTFMRKDQLGEGNLTNFQFGNSTFLRTEQQSDQGTLPLGNTSFLSQEQQLDPSNLQMDNSMFMSNEHVINEGSFKQGNSTFVSNGQQLDEGSFQLGKSTYARADKQIGEVNLQWWNNSFMNKDQQVCFRKSSEQQQHDWDNAIWSINERAASTSSSSTRWYQKEPIDQSLVSLFLVDNQQPNLALQL